MKKPIEQSAKLIKEFLGSIDLSDIEKLQKERLTDLQLRGRAQDTEIFYKNHFEKVLKLFIQAQLEWIGTSATDELKLHFGRGTLKGFWLVQEWFERRMKESLARFDKEEPSVPGQAIPPTGKLEQ